MGDIRIVFLADPRATSSEVNSLSLANHVAQQNPRGYHLTNLAPEIANQVIQLRELRRREGNNLHVQGVDMLDGTPILDIKPYLSSIPAERLRRGWLAEAEARPR